VALPLVVALAFGVAAAQAEDAAPEDFFGRYVGSSVAHSVNAADLSITLRDLDVEIGPEGDGFYVAWNTVIADPADDSLRRNQARVDFVPSGRPGIYSQRGAERELDERLSWGAIDADTLSVRTVSILDDGRYVVQTYHRSLVEDGLRLIFISDIDGQVVRLVNARLERAGNVMQPVILEPVEK
jgi:hypothetical protein